MTRTFVFLTLLTIVVSLVVLTEARYHGYEDNAPRHRHRHHHREVLTAKRNHETHKIVGAARKSTWSDDIYEDDQALLDAVEDDGKIQIDQDEDATPGDDDDDDDNDEDDDDDDDEDDYDDGDDNVNDAEEEVKGEDFDNHRRPARNYQSRSEQRYRGVRYHVNSRHVTNNPWQMSDDKSTGQQQQQQQRRSRNLRFRGGHRTRPWTITYPSRSHDSMNLNDDSDDEMDYDDYDRPRWHHQDNDELDVRRRSYHVPYRRDYGQYRNWEFRRDWKRKADERRRKSFHYHQRNSRLPFANYDDHENWSPSNWSHGRGKKSNITNINSDAVAESIWDAEQDSDEDEDVDDDDEVGIDSDYFDNDEPPYKTFDDIIKSLTSDNPTTTVKPQED